jgi:hypothetical protein
MKIKSRAKGNTYILEKKKINGLRGFYLRVDLFTPMQGKRDRW